VVVVVVLPAVRSSPCSAPTLQQPVPAVRCSPHRLWRLGYLRRRSDGLACYRSRRTRGSRCNQPPGQLPASSTGG
jgi:hypothetical protein